MRGNIIRWVIYLLLFAVSFSAQAQQSRKIPLIGYLAGAGSSPHPAFVKGLRDLGYVEGNNIAFAFRTTESRPERQAELAAELVSLKVDILMADSSGLSWEAKKATSTIPIVMLNSTDPVATGLVTSLARPGGNVTGFTNVSAELGGKLLELLKECVPKLNRVAILRSPAAANDLFQKETEASAKAMGIQVIPLVFRGPENFEELIQSAVKQRAQALIDRMGPTTSAADRKRVMDLSVKNRLLVISSNRFSVEAGGQIYYGPDLNLTYYRAATYVDKILKGTKPADLPVEAPINLT
jgi:putative tryptophan/tyrosine transport system substrate-binding protein